MIVVLCVSVGLNTNVKEIIDQKIAQGKMNITKEENPKPEDSSTKPDNKKDDTTPIVKPVDNTVEPKKDDVVPPKEEPSKEEPTKVEPAVVDNKPKDDVVTPKPDGTDQSSSSTDVKPIDDSNAT